ncbi:arylamine N-acetyltransferase family protein [Paenibacillus sp. PL91]|uniref:arylamine N-acetyltransferase family protein n=1 Tax=Paenibacillus sp. PL91 TaxID=2729538 RepID=UPI00145F4673|nr:arylamine N-acetyltransferase [Paenibacillus sp. PL91]MBC9202966.1 arylamine N-acetyltransferase [Paenibacillus sp. PL91]
MVVNSSNLKPEVLAYLERIGYSGPIDTTLATLTKLQECHVHTVPYENFDILNRVPLSLEVPDLLDKIVNRRRGGYCFELNALFGWLLMELGFKVTNYFARFWRDETDTPPKRRHHILQVEAEGELYLCDVGVGGIAPRSPIHMTENVVHEQLDEAYMLERDADFGWILSERKKGQWSRLYSFTEEPQLPKDFLMTSYWCENAPDSIFIKDAMAAIRTSAGRNTIAGEEFRIFTAEGVQAFTPKTKDEYAEALRTHFGININN